MTTVTLVVATLLTVPLESATWTFTTAVAGPPRKVTSKLPVAVPAVEPIVTLLTVPSVAVADATLNVSNRPMAATLNV